MLRRAYCKTYFPVDSGTPPLGLRGGYSADLRKTKPLLGRLGCIGEDVFSYCWPLPLSSGPFRFAVTALPSEEERWLNLPKQQRIRY